MHAEAIATRIVNPSPTRQAALMAGKSRADRPLGLHQITAMEAQPPELASIAAAVGCQEICVFTNIPIREPLDSTEPRPPFPLVTQSNKAALLERLNDLGVRVANVEFFSLTASLDLENYRPGLELGGELGSRCAVTHIYDPDRPRAVENLGRLGEMAAEYGLDVAVEFMGLSPECNSISRALELVQRVNRKNVGIAIDMLHLVRTGGTPADVGTAAPEWIRYAQICDGGNLYPSNDYMDEALNARMLPGEGCFPIPEILNALPHTLPLDVEVPRFKQQQQGVPALERARQAVSAARGLISALTPSC